MEQQVKRLRGELNEANEEMSSSLVKKIEVVIKRALGLKKLSKVSGPHKSNVSGELTYFFTIGDVPYAYHYGPTIIQVIKQISHFEGYDDYYRAGIALGGMMSDDYGGYGDWTNKIYSEAELLKAIYNMAKKEKEKLTFKGDVEIK